MTISTVGYGDIAPTKSGVQLFMSVWAVVGIVGIFALFTKNASWLQDKMNLVTRCLLGLCGKEMIDVERYGIAEHVTVSFMGPRQKARSHVQVLAQANGREAELPGTLLCGAPADDHPLRILHRPQPRCDDRHLLGRVDLLRYRGARCDNQA